MKIISWNVNGIRSNILDNNTAKFKRSRKIEDKSVLKTIIDNYNPDIICFQETRLGKDLYHLFESSNIKEFFPYQYWSSSQGEKGRAGNRYSGTSIWSKIKPDSVIYDAPGLNDKEGRFIQLNFKNCILITTYTPNTGSNWDYRLKHWEPIITKYLCTLSKGIKPLIYCGDNNIANINDVWFGKSLEKKYELEKDVLQKKKIKSKIASRKKIHTGEKILCGYSKQERDAYSNLVSKCNLIDCYRHLNPNSIDNFTWFNIRIKNSFKNNMGWLIDRFLMQSKFKNKINKCKILKEIGIRNENQIFISDHLPIFLDIEF